MSSAASYAARQAGHSFKFVASWERAKSLLEINDVQFLVIDLQTDGLNLDELEQGLNQIDESQRPTTVAYAQHVHADLLDKAQSLPNTRVLTRGQAHHGLSELLKA